MTGPAYSPTYHLFLTSILFLSIKTEINLSIIYSSFFFFLDVSDQYHENLLLLF